MRLIVADGDIDDLRETTQTLSKVKEIDILATTSDGAELIHITRTLKPDMLLTTLMLGTVDGLGVLEALSQFGLMPPKTLIITKIRNGRFIDNALKLGACYCMFKPVDKEIMRRRITQIALEHDVGTPRINHNMITSSCANILAELGIPPHQKGSDYLSTAVMLCMSDEEYRKSLTKRLYPEIAHCYGTTPQCVERSIRHAVSSAWLSGALDRYAAIHNRPELIRRRPTNGQMIALIAQIAASHKEET